MATLWRWIRTFIALPFYVVALIGALIMMVGILFVDLLFPNDQVLVKFIHTCVGFNERPVKVEVKDK